MKSQSQSFNGREYPVYPRIGVGTIVFNANQILLIKRGQEPKKGMWTLPGGLVETGETLENAARREVLEECGVKIQFIDKLDIFEFIDKDETERVRYHYILVDFFADYVQGTLNPGSDVDEAAWVKVSDIGRFQLSDSVK